MSKSLATLNVVIAGDLKGFERAVNNIEKKMNRFSRNMTNIGSSMTQAFTVPLAAIGAASVSAFGKMEKMQVALKSSFQGNEQAAKEAMDTIIAFTANTPFQLEEVTNGFIKLKNLGLDPSMEALTSYGNTASAMGKSLNDMIEAVADAATGEFERLKEFGIKAKKQGSDVAFTFQGITTVVKNTSEDIEGYLRNIGDTNFAGGMQAQSKTLLGIFSTLRDNINLALVDIGSEINKAFDLKQVMKDVGERIQQLVEWFKGLSDETKRSIVQWGLFVAAIGPALLIVGKLISSFTLVTTALKGVASVLAFVLSPIGLTVIAIGALGALAYNLYKDWDAFRARFANIWTKISNSVMLGVDSIKSMLNRLQKALGIDLWTFDTGKVKLGELIDEPSFIKGADLIKSMKDDFKSFLGLSSKSTSGIGGPDPSPNLIKGGSTSGGGSGGGGGAGSGAWAGASQDNLEKLKSGYEGVTLAVKSTGTAVQDMTMKIVEGSTASLTAMEMMAGSLTESLIQMSDSGAASMEDLAKATVASTRKIIAAKVREGVASAIASKMGLGPFGILLAAGAGLAASAIFTRILGGLKIPAFAAGGAARSPMLAMVGDNPNAMNDPEMIMPFSKMKNMILKDIVPSMRGSDYGGIGKLQFAPQEIRIAPTSIGIEGRTLRILLENENQYARALR